MAGMDEQGLGNRCGALGAATHGRAQVMAVVGACRQHGWLKEVRGLGQNITGIFI